MYIYIIGFLAQLFFSARILIQWIMSEKANKNVSPAIFWILSVAGAYLLFIYGWLRNDFAIILGQLISYYIYLWNLRIKGTWGLLFMPLRALLLLTPFVILILVGRDVPGFVNSFFHNDEIPFYILIYGSAGQVIFTLRFVYQWVYSRRRNQSMLPIGFWIISLAGSAIIVSYAFYRLDPVLILGQSIGIISYMRNIMIGYNEKKRLDETELKPYDE